MKLNNCVYCGKKLKGKQRKYCSREHKQLVINKRWRDRNKIYNREIQRISAEKRHDKIMEYQRKWRKENKEKQKAYDRLRKTSLRNIRKDVCAICGSKDKLIFHHTNYEKDEGFTCCEKCHKNIHRRVII